MKPIPLPEFDKVSPTFPVTHWSLVGRAGGAPGEARLQALAELIRQYLPALRFHLTRIKRLDSHTAEDILQGFLANKVLEQHLVSRADQSRGRFRSFLVTALDRFMLNEFRAERAAKRSPEKKQSLDEACVAVDPSLPPDEDFDVMWAREVLSQAVDRMRAECAAAQRPDIWGVFEGRVLGPTLDHAEPVSYEELIKRFNFQSPTQASNVLITATRAFKRCLRSVVGRYESDDTDIDGEILELQRILSNRRAGMR